MECTFARFRYGPTIQTVALYPGIPIEELLSILSTILPVVGKIVGLQDENGAVVPLSLACKLPNLLSQSLFVILVADSSSSTTNPTTIPNPISTTTATTTTTTQSQREKEAPTHVSPSAPPLISSSFQNDDVIESPNNTNSNELSLGAPPPPLQPSMDPEFDNVLSADDNAELADNTLDELLRFITGLRVKRVIQKEESDILEELLFNNSSLIFAAYSVAKSASDAQYLTAVCKDIAQSMVTSAGQSACAAQEDVLHCCDELYINNKITENQLLYLRHLVLIRDEDVAQMYDDYQENSDLDRLMIGLFRLANSQPKIAEEASAAANNNNNNNNNNSNRNQEKQQIEIQQSIKKQQDEITNNYKLQQQRQQQQQKLSIQTPPNNVESESKSKQSKKSRTKKDNPYGKKNSNSTTTTTTVPSNVQTNTSVSSTLPLASSSTKTTTKTSGKSNDRERERSNKTTNSSNLQSSSISESELKETNRSKNEKTIMLNTLNGIIALMIRTGDINSIEAIMLNHMISNENEFILAAYELFQSDGNVVELQDTLMRCAKIELKRRGLNQERSDKQVSSKNINNNNNNKQTTSPQRRQQQQQQNQNQVNNRDVSEADDEDSATSSDEKDDEDDDDDYENQKSNRSKLNDLELDDIPSEPFQTTESPSQLTRLLSNLNITNVWQNTVPNKFIFVVFSATQQRLLTLGQGRALCDLFQAQYDLVRAAWEVFNVQNDIYDFIDTLKRIVRDLNFQDNGNVNLSVDRDDNYEQELSETQSDDDFQLPSQNKNNNKNNNSNSNNKNNNILEVMKQTEDKAKEAREAKSNALAAVEEAKRELLKHSLEIMVKQGLVTTVAASNLYERALKGDPLTDAAIEGYAGDRNIMEFLDTLQILANNTPEDLEKMLRSAMSNDDENNDDNNNNNNNNNNGIEVEDEDGDNDNDIEYEEDNNNEDKNEDEDEDDVELDEVQLELKKIAKELYKQGELNEENYSSLLKLILVNDDRVLAAHDVYRDLQDKEDLSDSLIRISRKSNFQRQPSDDGIEMSNIQKSKQDEELNEVEMTHLKNNTRSKRNAEEPGVELSNMQTKKIQKETPTQRPQSPGLLNKDDQKSILAILTNAGVITDNQAHQITTLVDNGSREIQLIFKEYEKNKDVYTLIESLRFASSEPQEVEEEDDDNDNVDVEENNGDDDYEDDDDEGNNQDVDSTERVGEVDLDYEDYENDETLLDEDEKESIETKFLNIIQGMNLSHLETAALRLAIARDDPTIRHALETFRVNRNENVLMDTLRNVARQTINETLTEAGYDGIDEDEDNNVINSSQQQDNQVDNNNNEDNQDNDDENNQDNNDDNEDNVNEQDDDEEHDDEEEDNDDDDDDNSNTNGLISKSARQHIFPILINELLKEHVLSANETKKLLELFENDDDVVHAALDVYDLDSDLSELVDTLQRIVKTSST